MEECTRCFRILSESEFNKDKRKKNGLTAWCKSCIKVYRVDKKERYNLSVINWRKDNPEKQLKSMKNWRDNNKEKNKQIQKIWRKNNPNYLKDYEYTEKRINYNQSISRKISNLKQQLKIAKKESTILAIQIKIKELENIH